MRERTRQFKIGLFVLAAAAILVAAALAFGGRRRFVQRVTLETYVPGNVEGLTVGSAVKLKGVTVGEVTKISFSWVEYPGGEPSAVVVFFDVAEGVLPTPPTGPTFAERARQGLRAIVTTQGITGAAFLALDVVDPTRNPPLSYTWRARNEVIPSAESQLGRILSSVEKATAQLEKLDVERLNARLDRTLQAADEVLEKLSKLDVERLGVNVNRAIGSARGAALEVQAAASDVRGTLRGMHLDEVASDTRRLVVGLQASNASVQRLVDRLAEVDVGELNDSLASTRDAARHLNDAIEDLQRYPSGFLFGEKPEPVRGLDRSGR